MVTIPWDFKAENPCFDFCVGDSVSIHLVKNFLNKSKDVLEHCVPFDPSIVIGEFNLFKFKVIKNSF